MNLVVILLLVLLLCGGIGGVGYRSGWHPAYYGGGIGTVLVVLLILYLLGVV